MVIVELLHAVSEVRILNVDFTGFYIRFDIFNGARVAARGTRPGVADRSSRSIAAKALIPSGDGLPSWKRCPDGI